MIIDLHTHTNHSDGRNRPEVLIQLAKEAGIDVIAITDHERTDALEEAMNEGRRLGIRVIAGVEITTMLENLEVHLLGYNIDFRSNQVQTVLKQLRTKPVERIELILKSLSKMNVHIALEEVLSKSRNLPPNRSHIASLLVKRGYAKSRSDAFKRYLKTGRDSYIPSVEPTPEEGARFIKSAGGIPVVAHPGWLKDDEAIARLVADGIMGLEVFHIYRDMSVCNKYLQIARKYRLFVTGGSDWHGVVEYPHNANLGQITCPPEYFNELEKHFGGRWVE